MRRSLSSAADHVLDAVAGPLLPTRKVWGRYDTTPRTLDRWLAREELGFPKPIVINGRRYWHENKLIEWERSRATAKAEVA